jgi:nucleotide-binding universal stress UspA family protein
MVRWNPVRLDTQTLDEQSISMVCAYDGSQVASAAKDLVLEYFLPKRKNLKATFVYVDDPNKSYLPAKMKKSACLQAIETDSFLYGDRVDARSVTREADKCIGQHIVELSRSVDADFVVIGMYGRKGVKDQTDTIIASNANYALQYSPCSVVLIQEPFLPYSFVNYLVPMDVSKSSEKALVDALLLSEPDDEITILHIVMKDEQDRANDGPAHQDPLQGFRDKLGPLIHAWTTEIDRKRNVNIVYQDNSPEPAAHDIIQYAADHNIHIVCVGADVSRLKERKTYMGSTSASVVANCVRQGVPVVVSHYDDSFAEVGGDTTKNARAEYVPLPKTAQFATPGPAEAWDHKYRCDFGIGQTK